MLAVVGGDLFAQRRVDRGMGDDFGRRKVFRRRADCRLAGVLVGEAEQADLVAVLAGYRGVGDQRAEEGEGIEAQHAGRDPGAGQQLEILRHPAVEAEALHRVRLVDPFDGVADFVEAFFVEGLGGLVRIAVIARRDVRAAEADFRLAAGRRQLGLQPRHGQADGAAPVARPVALDRRRAGFGRAQRRHHRNARAAHPDRQRLDPVPQRLRHAGASVEQIPAVAENVFGEGGIGLQRRDQQVVGAGDVQVLVDPDLAQVAQGRLEPARHRLAFVHPVGAAEAQDHIETEVRREGVVPGQPVADYRRLVVQERPDLADLGQRRTHQPLGVDYALGHARAARGQQDLADAVARHCGVGAFDRLARRAGQQVVERDGAGDGLDIPRRDDGRIGLHCLQRRPERRRILDIDQARREAVADMADLGEILRHERIGRRHRHRRDADLHRAELQDREVQAVVAQDRDRIVAVMAVVEQPLRDPVRPVARRSVGQVDPVAVRVALGEEGAVRDARSLAAQIVGHLHRIGVERRRVAQEDFAVVPPLDLQRAFSEPQRRIRPVLGPAGRRIGVGNRARVVHRACDTSTTTAIALSPAAQPVNRPRPPPRCTSSSTSSITRRRPVGPFGWPKISEQP